MPYGSVADLIKAHFQVRSKLVFFSFCDTFFQDGLPELACCLITRDLCSALHYLHSQVSKSPEIIWFCIPLTSSIHHSSGCCSSFSSSFPYSHLWHRSCSSWGSQVELCQDNVLDMIFKVLYPTSLHGREQIKPLQLPSSWSCRQPFLAGSWNIATESAGLQRDQRHLQPGGHPVWDGQWHRALQWDAANLDAAGEVERCCS